MSRLRTSRAPRVPQSRRTPCSRMIRYLRSGWTRRKERASAMWPRLMLGGAVEVGDRAGDPQHPVVAARGQVHALGRAQQQLAAAGVGRRDLVEQLALDLGVGAQLGARRAGEALGLELARAGDPGGDPGARLAGRRRAHLGGGERRHLDVQVDAVEQRARDPRLVVARAARRAARRRAPGCRGSRSGRGSSPRPAGSARDRSRGGWRAPP